MSEDRVRRCLWYVMKQWLVLAALFLPPITAAEAELDCSLFFKKLGGVWFLSAQTTVEFGRSKITLAPGDVPPRRLMFGTTDLHGVIEHACQG